MEMNNLVIEFADEALLAALHYQDKLPQAISVSFITHRKELRDGLMVHSISACIETSDFVYDEILEATIGMPQSVYHAKTERIIDV